MGASHRLENVQLTGRILIAWTAATKGGTK